MSAIKRGNGPWEYWCDCGRRLLDSKKAIWKQGKLTHSWRNCTKVNPIYVVVETYPYNKPKPKAISRHHGASAHHDALDEASNRNWGSAPESATYLVMPLKEFNARRKMKPLACGCDEYPNCLCYTR